MSAQTHYGRPIRLTDDGLTVHYADGRTCAVLALKRADLMRLASAVAGPQDAKPTLALSNDELRAYVEARAPWESDSQDEEEQQQEEQETIPTEIEGTCGHTFTYRIGRAGYDAKHKWLKTQACPRCRKGSQKQQEEQKQETQEEPKQQQETTESAIDLDELAEIVASKLQERMAPVRMPKLAHECLPEVLRLMQAGCNAWLQGPPGTGKSTIVQQAAEALEVSFYPMSCHEGMTQSQLFGYIDANGTVHRSPLWDAFEHGGVLLLDEMDNGNSNILAALNAVLSNDEVTFCGQSVSKHPQFIAAATANTAGMGPEAGFLGRQGVDAATLDRFVLQYVPIDLKLETAVVSAIAGDELGATIVAAVQELRSQVEARGLDLTISPRTSIHAARMIKAGFELEDALSRTALRAVDETTKRALLEGSL